MAHHDTSRHNAHETDNRSLREIEAAHQQREGLSRRQNQQRRALHQYISDIGAGEKVRAEDGKRDDHYEERNGRSDRSRVYASQQRGPPATDDHVSRHAACPWVMASTRRIGSSVSPLHS